MESTIELKNLARETALTQWLRGCQIGDFSLKPLPGDASFRRYFRVQTSLRSYIAMDAPPPLEQCGPFVAIAKALYSMQLKVPEIIQAEMEQGFLLLTDFGDQTYLSCLNEKNADKLYTQALDALAIMQGCQTVSGHLLPTFTADFMLQEWAWHKEWFLNKWLAIESPPSLEAVIHLMIEKIASQPYVFMHRDYHSANLMLTANEETAILDFQDAFRGPITYDVASLLRDCYIDWPAHQINTWVLYYHQLMTSLGVIQVPASTFLQWFDWMSMQRHLKALFTFSRKEVRDHQSKYLAFVPRTLTYFLEVSSRYPELSHLHHYYLSEVLPAYQRKIASCVA